MCIRKRHLWRLGSMACSWCIFVCMCRFGILSSQSFRLGMSRLLLIRWKCKRKGWAWFSSFHQFLWAFEFRSFCVCQRSFPWRGLIQCHPCLWKKIQGTDHRDNPVEWRIFQREWAIHTMGIPWDNQITKSWLWKFQSRSSLQLSLSWQSSNHNCKGCSDTWGDPFHHQW